MKTLLTILMLCSVAHAGDVQRPDCAQQCLARLEGITLERANRLIGTNVSTNHHRLARVLEDCGWSVSQSAGPPMGKHSQGIAILEGTQGLYHAQLWKHGKPIYDPSGPISTKRVVWFLHVYGKVWK